MLYDTPKDIIKEKCRLNVKKNHKYSGTIYGAIPKLKINWGILETTREQSQITLQPRRIFFTSVSAGQEENKEIPNFNHLKNNLKQKINIEKQLAQNKDKQEINNIKWRPLLSQI